MSNVEQSDIRAFYAVNNKPGQNPVFTPFPGYLNLNSRGQVILLQENNDGRSDRYVQKDFNTSFCEWKSFLHWIYFYCRKSSFI